MRFVRLPTSGKSLSYDHDSLEYWCGSLLYSWGRLAQGNLLVCRSCSNNHGDLVMSKPRWCNSCACMRPGYWFGSKRATLCKGHLMLQNAHKKIKEGEAWLREHEAKEARQATVDEIMREAYDR